SPWRARSTASAAACRPLDARSSDQERDDRADEEHHEENLRDACGARRDATEAEEGRDDRDDEEHDRIVKHVIRLRLLARCVPTLTRGSSFDAHPGSRDRESG